MCSSHIGTRALVGKAFREEFYWPLEVADAHEVVRTCSNCQKHAHYNNFPLDEVHLGPPMWPLARWGIDIIGRLPTAPVNYKYAAVAVYYFSQVRGQLHRSCSPAKVFLAKCFVLLRRAKGGHY